MAEFINVAVLIVSCLCHLVKRLAVCEEAETGSCGNILFYSMLQPPG